MNVAVLKSYDEDEWSQVSQQLIAINHLIDGGKITHSERYFRSANPDMARAGGAEVKSDFENYTHTSALQNEQTHNASHLDGASVGSQSPIDE